MISNREYFPAQTTRSRAHHRPDLLEQSIETQAVKNMVALVAWTVAVSVIMYFIISAWTDQPRVYWSNTKNDCAYVDLYGVIIDCSEFDFDQTYEKVYVE